MRTVAISLDVLLPHVYHTESLGTQVKAPTQKYQWVQKKTNKPKKMFSSPVKKAPPKPTENSQLANRRLLIITLYFRQAPKKKL